MLKQLVLILMILLLGQGCSSSAKIDLVSVDADRVIVCDAHAESTQMATLAPGATEATIQPSIFTESGCKIQSLWEIDPQNSAIWAKFSVEIPPSMLYDKQPVSVYVSGKTSSRVYFNETYLGQNGTPSINASDEFPGKIDAMFYVPPSLIKPSGNHIAILFSSHHGFLQLKNPINFIGFGSYSGLTAILQQHLGPALLPLGALVLGALYFFVASFSPINRQTKLLFLLMCSLASCQLLAEISRTLFSYSYPMHDLRLMLIACLSWLFGVSLLYFISKKLEFSKAVLLTVLGGIASLIAVYLTPGFDSKTAVGVLMPGFFCTALTAVRLFKQPSKDLLISLLVFLIFIAIVFMTFSYFHEVIFYYMITTFLGLLFIQQALTLSKEQEQRMIEQQQIAKLKFKLEQNKQKEQPQKISINSSGKVELIASKHIAYCKAAGDYVELYLLDGKEILFSGNLKELETQLPSTFLRVHRSYLVNLSHVQALNSNSLMQKKVASGGGFLTLNGNFEVPVSRRIMPQVRNMLR